MGVIVLCILVDSQDKTCIVPHFVAPLFILSIISLSNLEQSQCLRKLYSTAERALIRIGSPR